MEVYLLTNQDLENYIYSSRELAIYNALLSLKSFLGDEDDKEELLEEIYSLINQLNESSIHTNYVDIVPIVMNERFDI